MKRRPVTAKTVVGPVVTVVAIGASALIWQNLPTSTDIYAPFAVGGKPGALVQGHNLSATVTGARIAAQVTADSILTPAPVAAVGQWMVLDATMIASTNPSLPRVMLIAGFDDLPRESWPGRPTPAMRDTDLQTVASPIHVAPPAFRQPDETWKRVTLS